MPKKNVSDVRACIARYCRARGLSDHPVAVDRWVEAWREGYVCRVEDAIDEGRSYRLARRDRWFNVLGLSGLLVLIAYTVHWW